MKLSERAKLLLSFMSLVALIVILSLSSYRSMVKLGTGAADLKGHAADIELAGDIQLVALDALMPVNDYLITGDKSEAENFTALVADLRGKLDKLKKVSGAKERELIKSVEPKLEQMEKAGMAILAKDVAGSNAEQADAMKEFDALGESVEYGIEDLHQVYRARMADTTRMVDDTKKNAINHLLLISVLSVILGTSIGLFMSRALSKPIMELVGVARDIAAGDLTRRVEVKSKDELGELGTAINSMVDGLRGIVSTINRSAAEVAVAADQVSISSDSIKNGAESQSHAADETSSSMEEMAASIQTVAGNADSLASNVEETSASINQMVASIEQIAKNADGMASSVSETSATIEQMAVSIERVAKDADALASSVEETSATIEQMVVSTGLAAKNSDILSRTVSETSSTIEEMAASITQVAKNTAEADQISRKAAQEAEDGGKAVELTIQGMGRISQTMEGISDAIGGLGRRSEEIGSIIGVIEEIADQTNLLALNAAIEAARAGDAGRGFAVVADEVRKLAERSVVATREIGEVIKQVQQETAKAVKSVEAGAGETAEGIKLADKAGAALKRILDSVGESSRLMSEMAMAAEEQSTAASQVLKSVEDMSRAAEQVTTAIKEQATGSDQIRAAVEKMNSITHQVAGAMKEQGVGGGQIRTAVEDMNRVTEQVSTATKEQASGSAQIMRAVENMNIMTQQVANATAEQKKGGALVVKSVENIADIARENLSTILQVSGVGGNMILQAETLQQAISIFKLSEITTSCWDIMNCSMDLREKCPAYQNPERRCWLISGTWCKGVQQGDARGKLKACMHCEVFKVMQGIDNLPSAAKVIEAGVSA